MSIYIILIYLFFSSFVYGLIGFGDALILIPLITPFIGIQTAVILTTIWGILPTILNYIHYKDYIDKNFAYKAIISGTPGVIVGTLLITYMKLELIELILGIFIVIYSLTKLVKIKNLQDEAKLKKEINNQISDRILIIGGFSYGFFGGLIGASGPINVALLEGTGHYKENFIGNFAIIGLILGSFKFPLYFINGIFPFDLWLIILLGIPIIYLSTKFGHLLTPKISERKFRIIILLFLFIIGMKAILFSTFFN